MATWYENAGNPAIQTIHADVIAAPVTIGASNATQNIDFSTAQIFPFTVTSNATFTVTNATPGQMVTLVLTQGASAQGTGTFPSTWKFPGATKTLSSTASYVDTVNAKCINGGLFLCTIALAYA